MLRIEKLMKRDLISVRSDETAFGASLLMRVLNVGSVFVKEQDTIIGIVTESDIVKKVVSMSRIPEHTPVTRVMSAPVIGIGRDRPVFEAADMMQLHGTRHLAVTQENEIVGVLSVRDMLHPVAVDDL
ncbi:MAG: CBS domain-containing protein [Nitrospira sp.]|nr:CBS domain-containing protein [Nitrospira sp.]